ncbi:MAG: hypothetical protein HOP29_15815 [Phycisphaerales bacterium]|nr:hypothetical protein [Phycisphaerales bacterium]
MLFPCIPAHWVIWLGFAASPPPAAVDPTGANAVRANSVDAAPAPVPSSPADGFWPTAKMMDGLLARWADDNALKYGLNAPLAERHREQLVDRWKRFASENRAALQPLLNEYIESRLAVTPPDPAAVRNWAERAMPMFESFREELMQSHNELSDDLPPFQRARLALDGVKIGAVMEGFRARLRAWGDGRFDEHEWWDPPRSVRSERGHDPPGDSDRRADDANRRPAKEKMDEELLRWDYHVAKFIEMFQLDEAQRQAAYSILRECRGSALAHLDRYRARMEKLERSIAKNDGKMDVEQRAEATALYGPVDSVFVDLKRRVDQIPTTAQRAAAAVQVSPPTDGPTGDGSDAVGKGTPTDDSPPN